MFRKAYFRIIQFRTVIVAWACLAVITSSALAESESLAKQIPADAIFYAEVSNLGDVIHRVRDSALMQMVLDSPQYKQYEKSPPYQKFQAGRQIVETQLGMDAWKAVETVFGGQIAVGLFPHPGRDQPDAVLVFKTGDAAGFEQLKSRFAPFITLLEGQQVDTSDSIDGTSILTVKGPQATLFAASEGEWILAASTKDLLKRSMELSGESKAKSLADSPSFQSMAKDLAGEHLLQAYVNTETIIKATNGKFIPEKADNALASLLFGGIADVTRRSRYAGLAIDVKEQQFEVTTSLGAKPSEANKAHQSFFSNPTGSGTPTLPIVKNLIGGFSIYRDYAKWYASREELMDPDILPGFDQFETGLANLLPGKDFGEDVLPLIGQNITFVAAPQDYDHLDGEPGVKLPGFGLIIEMAKPQEASDLIQLFFQTLSSILNIQAGQQGRQPWVMSSETYKNVQISYGRYLQKPKGKSLPFVFNFMPASARVGNKYIITSSRDLCHKLIDDATNDGERKPPNRNFDLAFYLDPFADILEANQAMFQARAIQEGDSPAEAKSNFGKLIEVLRMLNAVKLSTSVKPEAFQIRLQGSWK